MLRQRREAEIAALEAEKNRAKIEAENRALQEKEERRIRDNDVRDVM